MLGIVTHTVSAIVVLKPPCVCVCVCVCVCTYSVAQSCLILCDPMDYSPPGFSVRQILQARTLELVVAISFFRGSFRPSNQTHVSCISCIGRQILYHWATWEAPKATIDHPRAMWSWPCFNKTLFMDTEIWISYQFHLTPNVILLLVFLQWVFKCESHS